ncbi:MAG: hypothetical protein ACKVGZ_21175, partial [Alphaproteobacteria bacterium]
PIQAVVDSLPETMSQATADRVAARAQRWSDEGIEPSLAAAVARMDPTVSALDIVQLAGETDDNDLQAAATAYYAAGKRLRLSWCRQVTRSVTAATAWEQQAVDALLEDFYGHQAEIARRALSVGGLDDWMTARQRHIDRLEGTLDEMAATEPLTLAMATVANSLYRGLSAS